MSTVLSILIGYFIGNINPAYIFAKIRGFDIRKRGSGNAGASNAVITMGKTVGILSAIFDIAKAYFAVRLATFLFPDLKLAEAASGTACILGHIFPLLMGFKGGKGLACLGGTILAFDARFFAVLLIFELILVLIVDYICIVPTTASVIFPIVYGLMTRNLVGALLLTAPTVVILIKHIENFKRIKAGTEVHFSFLWRREREIERIQQKLGSDSTQDKL